MIDSNNNDTEIAEDLPEEQALQLKVLACRSKAKANPERREPANYSPSIIPMKGIGLTVNQGITISLCVRGFEESNPYPSTFSESTTRR